MTNEPGGDEHGGVEFEVPAAAAAMSNPTVQAGAVAAVFLVGSAAVIGYALGWPTGFGATTRSYPFVMGFIKLFFLGTLGELLKFRLVKGAWQLDKVFQRAAVWGLFGLWFTLAFRGFSGLVDALVLAKLWPEEFGVLPRPAWMAFSKSLWINLLGMFGWGMMVTHEYFNHLIRSGWRSWGLSAFAADADAGFLLSFIPKTLAFWIPAHTFTFAMPDEWRVFIAALLAIVLGFLLSVGRRARRLPSHS